MNTENEEPIEEAVVINPTAVMNGLTEILARATVGVDPSVGDVHQSPNERIADELGGITVELGEVALALSDIAAAIRECFAPKVSKPKRKVRRKPARR